MCTEKRYAELCRFLKDFVGADEGRRRAAISSSGGRGEIRTHEGADPLPVFKTGALNHSATLPCVESQYPIVPRRSKLKYVAAGEITTERNALCQRSGTRPKLPSVLSPIALAKGQIQVRHPRVGNTRCQIHREVGCCHQHRRRRQDSRIPRREDSGIDARVNSEVVGVDDESGRDSAVCGRRRRALCDPHRDHLQQELAVDVSIVAEAEIDDGRVIEIARKTL